MAGVGAEGLFVDDERVLSVLRIEVGDSPLVHLASASCGGTSEFVASARHLGNDGADPTVEVHRRRDLVRGGLTETVSVTSRADTAVVTDVVVIVGGDGASVSAVKSGLGAWAARRSCGRGWRTPRCGGRPPTTSGSTSIPAPNLPWKPTGLTRCPGRGERAPRVVPPP